MDKFSIDSLLNEFSWNGYIKSSIEMISYVLGEDFENKDNLIYCKNLYRYLNEDVPYEEVQYYFVHNKNIYCIYADKEDNYINRITTIMYSDIKDTVLRKRAFLNRMSLSVITGYGDIVVDLTVENESASKKIVKLYEDAMLDIYYRIHN